MYLDRRRAANDKFIPFLFRPTTTAMTTVPKAPPVSPGCDITSGWWFAGSREAVTQLTNNNQKPARDTHIQLHCYNSIPLVHGISLLRPFGGASSFWLASFRYLFLWLTLNRGLVFLSGIWWLWWHSPTNVRICVCRLQSHYQPHRHPFNYPLGVYSYQLPICCWRHRTLLLNHGPHTTHCVGRQQFSNSSSVMPSD